MDLRQPPPSAFSRFSDMIKETTRRRSSIASPLSSASSTSSREHDGSFIRRLSRDDRRSSTAQFTDKMRQMLSPTHRSSVSVNDLPVEVWHHILLYLDFWTLLQCQRVCRLWKNLIPGDSPLLAEDLYLKPSGNLQIYNSVPATFDFDFDIEHKAVEQPSHSRVLIGPQKEFTMTRRCLGLIRTSSEIVFHPVVLNFDHFLHSEVFRGVSADGGTEVNEQGSWRNMLVSMPPLRELALRHGKKRTMYGVLRVREGEEGITLGDLMQAMDEWDEDLTTGEVSMDLVSNHSLTNGRRQRRIDKMPTR